MSSTPLVSVIVPIYNVEKLLGRCIDSLLKQNYSNIEIILINDGSIDNSFAIAEGYSRKDERIKLFTQKNGGVSRARNLGLSKASGDYICFVDSDDYVDINYITAFISGLGTDVDLVFQGITEIHNDKSRKQIIPDGKFYSFDDVLDGISDINKYRIFGYVCNKLYKKSIIHTNNLQFREDVNISEDRIFALRYLRFVNSMRVVAVSAYNYEILESGLTFRKRSFKEIKRVADINLQEALFLLNQRNSSRFERDTKRMYIMTSLGYISGLFDEDIDTTQRYRELKEFREKYSKWLPEYKPVTRGQKIIHHSLYLPTLASLFTQSIYWYVKRVYEKFSKTSLD